VPKASDQAAASTSNKDAGDEDDLQPITITGDVDGVNAAKMEIEAVVRERASRSRACIPIERSFHPFICGPNNVTIQNIMIETGVKIHVPPSFGSPSVEKVDRDGNAKNMDEFIVIGEKDNVALAVEQVTNVYEEVVYLVRN
jgi:hypothetical protein